MSSTAAIASSTASATAPKAADSRKAIAQNFDSFLLLLTTQLKNQSPLDPLDTNQFTQQLVQFASVEQQMKSNDTLSSLLVSTRAATASTAADFVGMTVTADGSRTALKDGKATWTVTPARAAAQAVFTIKDASGAVVASKTAPMTAGQQSFVWDGRTSTGQAAPEGTYTLTVTGRDVGGQAVQIKTEVAGRVDRVDLSGDTPTLEIGTVRVALSDVRSISKPSN